MLRVVDHDLRQILAGEAHTRPTAPVQAPALVLHEARLHPGDGGAASRAFAGEVARAQGLEPPPREVDHLILEIDGALWKWERHGEFSTWTVVIPGAFDAAAPVPAPPLLAQAPGARFAAVAVYVAASAPTEAELDRVLGPETPENERCGALISGGAAGLWTGLRIGADGWTRFLFADLFGHRFRIGRMVRRLLEIETYRILALFAFPLAKEARRDIDRLETQVGAAIAAVDKPESEVLDDLIDASREIERIAYETAFRFGAAGAYRRLVEQRLDEFREVRIEGLQRLSAFLGRRFFPAMDTCAHTQTRLETLAKRVERAAGMLRTRVDLARAAQNQQLLGSMNDNAKAQLRLQKAVEGFSVAAISYYAYSLASKSLQPFSSSLNTPNQYLFETALVLATVGIVWTVLSYFRRKV